MYLSRLILNPRSRAVQRDLARPHELHRTISRAFPDQLGQTDERTLHRLDQTESGRLQLLVQSQLEPDWAFLDADGYLQKTQSPNPAVKAVDLTLALGQRLAFRLRANPTKRLSAGKGNKGKRVGLYTPKEQIDWLRRKGDDHGFVLQTVLPAQQRLVRGRIPAKAPGPTTTQKSMDVPSSHHDAKFYSVQYNGVLQVTDPEKFLAAINSGIGSGKAFGFGLLSIAPAH